MPVIQQKAVMLPDMVRKRLHLTAIEVVQPPAANAYHVGVQMAVGVVADILVAGRSPLRRGKAAHLAGGGQPFQMAVDGGLADPLALQRGAERFRGDRPGQRYQLLQNERALTGLIALFHGVLRKDDKIEIGSQIEPIVLRRDRTCQEKSKKREPRRALLKKRREIQKMAGNTCESASPARNDSTLAISA